MGLMKTHTLLLAVSLTLAICALPVRAQGPATVTGRVTNASGQPENEGSVRIDALNVATRTSADGTFRLVVPASRIRSGQQFRITASRVGLRAQSRMLTLSPGADVTQNFELSVEEIFLGKRGGGNSVEAEIVALEKRAFEAWKNKDKKFFEEHMWEDGQYLDQNGVGGKAQYVQVIIDNNCTVNSYSLDKTKVTMLSKDAALLTYIYKYDIVCGGKPEAGLLWSSTAYVKRGGKWLIAFHQEIPAAQAK